MTRGSTTIIVPVLGRPHRVAPLVASIDEATPEPHRTVFIVSHDDPAERGAIDELSASETVTVVVTPWAGGTPGDYARKINAGYRHTTEALLFLAADDLLFHPGWLSRAIEHIDAGAEVVGTNDITNPRVMTGQHSTHTLVTRRYIETQSGVIDTPDTVLFERYAHEFCDDEFIQTAMARGVYSHAFDSIVEHLHYLVGKAEMDKTYQIGKSRTPHSRRLFQQRRKLWQTLPS